MASITIREYDPRTGSLIGNISSLKFGKVGSGTHTSVKVIDIAFNDVSNVGNVYLGLVSSGGLTVNPSPEDIDVNGASGNGQFGIESSGTFDSAKTASPLSRHFAGLNGTGLSTNGNNVLVGTRSSSLSNFIYLDIEVGSQRNQKINGSYKVFFDFS